MYIIFLNLLIYINIYIINLIILIMENEENQRTHEPTQPTSPTAEQLIPESDSKTIESRKSSIKFGMINLFSLTDADVKKQVHADQNFGITLIEDHHSIVPVIPEVKFDWKHAWYAIGAALSVQIAVGIITYFVGKIKTGKANLNKVETEEEKQKLIEENNEKRMDVAKDLSKGELNQSEIRDFCNNKDYVFRNAAGLGPNLEIELVPIKQEKTIIKNFNRAQRKVQISMRSGDEERSIDFLLKQNEDGECIAKVDKLKIEDKDKEIADIVTNELSNKVSDTNNNINKIKALRANKGNWKKFCWAIIGFLGGGILAGVDALLGYWAGQRSVVESIDTSNKIGKWRNLGKNGLNKIANETLRKIKWPTDSNMVMTHFELNGCLQIGLKKPTTYKERVFSDENNPDRGSLIIGTGFRYDEQTKLKITILNVKEKGTLEMYLSPAGDIEHAPVMIEGSTIYQFPFDENNTETTIGLEEFNISAEQKENVAFLIAGAANENAFDAPFNEEYEDQDVSNKDQIVFYLEILDDTVNQKSISA